ncbi:MAG: hypothetical protein WC956_02170 [bacterium]
MKTTVISAVVVAAVLCAANPSLASVRANAKGVPAGGGFQLLLKSAGGWAAGGSSVPGAQSGEPSIDATGALPDVDGEYKVRISHAPQGLADLDGLSLIVGKKKIKVAKAFDVDTGDDLTQKLNKSDFDVIDARGRTVEVVFDGKGASRADGPITVAISGRERDSDAFAGIPCAFPSRLNPWNGEEATFSYELNRSFGVIKVDGAFTTADRLDEPSFIIPIRSKDGKPGGYAYGYVRNDYKYLYGAIDFTPDNTRDSGEDFATILINTPQGWREFRVSARDTEWGMQGYAYTDKVHYQHKIYEFRIPLSALGVSAKRPSTLQLRYIAFGAALPFAGR